MAHVVDVAAYILECLGSVSTMKLQKLTFYSQAYYLVEHGTPLFPEEFEAWANGPVAPDLFKRHKGEFVGRTSLTARTYRQNRNKGRTECHHTVQSFLQSN